MHKTKKEGKFSIFENEQIDFGHFKNVHFPKTAFRKSKKVHFSLLEHNALISEFSWKNV